MSPEDAAAHIEIQQVIYRYCRGVDRADADLVASVYHPDGIDNHGAFSGSGREFAEMLVPMIGGATQVCQHHITNMLIELDGDTAQVESYFVAFHALAASQGGGRAFAVGHYLDRFEKRGGAWKIAERTVIIDGEGRPDSDFDTGDDYPKGALGDTDLSAGRFSKLAE